MYMQSHAATMGSENIQSTPSFPPEGELGMQPPFFGYIETTKDALLVFEAARRGMVPRVTRRLLDTEKQQMIKSGAVFIFDSSESGIRRWTDGMEWSPSRILGNFLVCLVFMVGAGTCQCVHLLIHQVYREQPKINKRGSGDLEPLLTSPTGPTSQTLEPSLSDSPPDHPADNALFGQGELRPRSSSDAARIDKQRERQLVGSLTNDTRFKANGLVKKVSRTQASISNATAVVHEPNE